MANMAIAYISTYVYILNYEHLYLEKLKAQ